LGDGSWPLLVRDLPPYHAGRYADGAVPGLWQQALPARERPSERLHEQQRGWAKGQLVGACPTLPATPEGNAMKVDVNELERCLRYLKEINNAALEDIVWMRGDTPLSVDPDALWSFSFVGLSNRDFPSYVGWMPDGVGIRIVTMTASAKETP
jgi:hypothetical protein